MSKRFGRNQRRRAREAVARLSERARNCEAALEMDRGLLRDTSRKLSDLREELADAKRRAARLSVLFPAEDLYHNRERDGYPFMLPVTVNRSLESFSFDDAPLDMMLQTVPLELLVSHVDQNAMARAMHVRVDFAGTETAYGMTETAMFAMSPHDMKRRLTIELAKSFAQKIALALRSAGRFPDRYTHKRAA